MTLTELRETINSNGWRQGSALAAQSVVEVRWFDSTVDGDGLLALIISQDCDIVAANFTGEPIVEVVAGHFVDLADGNFRKARNPRKLDVDVTLDGKARVLRLETKYRGVIDRARLAATLPADLTLDDAQLHSLVLWLMKRYERPSFPDTFNSRLRPQLKSITKLLKAASAGQPLQLLLQFDEKELKTELPEDQPYHVSVVVELEGDSAPGDKEWDTFEQGTFDPLVEVMKRINGIKILDAQLINEFQLSHGDVRQMRRLDFDHLSLEGESDGQIALTD